MQITKIQKKQKHKCGTRSRKLFFISYPFVPILNIPCIFIVSPADKKTVGAAFKQGASPARTASLSSTTRLKMKRMYLEGWGVRGPSLPNRCRILVASTVCSQSSMNSQRCARPVSLLSGFSSMMLMMQSTMARLYSKPPFRTHARYLHSLFIHR